MDFDAERFIEEVRIRPALWHTLSEEYPDKNARTKYWNELVSTFAGIDISKITERERREMIKTLRRKWKSFRDCFSRENNRLKQARTTGDPGLRKTQYIYYKKLLFLKKNDPDNDGEIEEDPLEIDDAATRRNKIIFSRNRPRKKSKIEIKSANSLSTKIVKSDILPKQTPKVPKPVQPLIDPICQDFRFKQIDIFPVTNGQPVVPENEIAPEDSDRLFLLSLLEPLKNIPDQMRFRTKIELMRVIQNAQIDNSSPQYGSVSNEPIIHDENMIKIDESDDSIELKSPSLLDQLHFEPEMEITEFV